jgi:serine phosphatase RsbU (regulator of sigma subunit)
MKVINNFLRYVYTHFKIKTVFVVFIAFGIVSIPALLINSFIAIRIAEDSINPIISEKLISLRNNKAQVVQNYFANKFHVIQLIASSNEIIKATNDFEDSLPLTSADFLKTPEQQKITLEQSRSRLEKFYKTSFLPELGLTASNVQYSEKLLPSSNAGIMLQDAFIASVDKNTNPISVNKSDKVLAYSNFHEKYHPDFRKLINENQFLDMYLIGTEGNVLYSAQKKVDFATKLTNTYFKNEGLAKAYEKVTGVNKSEIVFIDYSPYSPSVGLPSAFIATPIFDDDKRVGSLIIQIGTSDLTMQVTNHLRWLEDGLGETGEVIITGQDGRTRIDTRKSVSSPEDFINSLGVKQNPSLINAYSKFNSDAYLRVIDSVATQKAAKDIIGIDSYTNYYGQQVIGAYKPFVIQDTKWVVTSEISKDQAEALVNSLKRNVWYASFLILLIVGPLAYFFAKLFLSPLYRLLATIEKVRVSDDLSLRVKSRGTVEVNRLRDSFNTMLDSLERNKRVISESKKQIEDSILVAQRIQKSYLPNLSVIQDYFKDLAIYWSPKEIVGGDFYWIKKFGSRIYVVCADCTGHGVPGAFMSLVAISTLDQIPAEIYSSASLEKIVEKVHVNFSKALALDSQYSEINDGFEASFLCFDNDAKSVDYLGMGMDLLIKNRDGSVQAVEGSKQPMGYKNVDIKNSLKARRFALGQSLYVLYSDGFPTQIGEQKRRMWGNKSLLNALSQTPYASAREVLQAMLGIFAKWRGAEPQRDDLTMLVIEPRLDNEWSDYSL